MEPLDKRPTPRLQQSIDERVVSGPHNTVPKRWHATYGEGGGVDLPVAEPLAVSVLEAGKLTQNAGTMTDTTVGSTFNGVPAVLAAAGVAYTDGDLVVVKLEYEAVDDAVEASDWMTTAAEFEVYATGSIPTDTIPSWSGTLWSTGVYYMTWATTDSGDGSVTATETGPCRIVYCSESDIRVVT